MDTSTSSSLYPAVFFWEMCIAGVPVADWDHSHRSILPSSSNHTQLLQSEGHDDHTHYDIRDDVDVASSHKSDFWAAHSDLESSIYAYLVGVNPDRSAFSSKPNPPIDNVALPNWVVGLRSRAQPNRKMDESSQAVVDHFLIGPSSIIGRTIAFRVLFCRSMSEFRRKVTVFLLAFFERARGLVVPVLSWFHPRNTQGILIMVTLIAFFLKRFINVRSRAAAAYRRKFWRNMMRSALTYDEWAHAAKMLDRETPRTSESDFYDVELVRNKLQELRHRRQEGSLRDIVFCMRADLLRNLGNMCNPLLHKERLQVPRLIKDYIDEVSTQLKMVCDSESEELLLEEKLSFMHETRHAFGRTALLLSGGASLGTFHVGVVRTLVENKLLPRIIAGSSVGSIVCAVVATRSWPELETFFENNLHSLQFFDQLGGVFDVVRRIMMQGAVHDIRQLQRLLRNLTSNLTFQEAYDMTGRILGITVCSPRKHEPPRCLNYLTSPHVVIWSAVTASCAFPGLFEAQELMAKNRSGGLVPFHAPFPIDPEDGADASSRRWRDGSLESDLPTIQLKELFNVNHFIVSQANPHIAPLLRLKEFVRAYGGSFAAKLAHLTEMEVKHRCNQILELGFPLGGLAKLFAQEWEGDVTVVMPATLAQLSKVIQNPSYLDLQKAANQGRRCTWEKLSAIKANCAIELQLDECVALLNHMRRLKRSAERAAAFHASANPPLRFSASKRIPSWNCIARENSEGSLEEEVLAAAHNQGSTCIGGHRPVHDSSDSESDTADHHGWTKAGGPLMRTASAKLFINFVQNLDVNAELKTWSGEDDTLAAHSGSLSAVTPERSTDNTDLESPNPNRSALSCTSRIVVSDGDLLQPERSQNGIVFNVVKKEDHGHGGSNESTQENVLLPDQVEECMQIDSCNASVTSDNEDDHHHDRPVLAQEDEEEEEATTSNWNGDPHKSVADGRHEQQ